MQFLSDTFVVQFMFLLNSASAGCLPSGVCVTGLSGCGKSLLVEVLGTILNGCAVNCLAFAGVSLSDKASYTSVCKAG